MDPLWVSVSVTIILAGITAYYAYETRRIRQETLRPRLSLHTGIYTDEGGVHALKLRNTGPVARNLDVIIECSEGTHEKKKTCLSIPSLNTGEEVYLTLKLGQIKASKGSVTVSITFRDASNREIKETLPTIDFAELATKEIEISQISNPLLDALEDISRKIDKR